MVAAIPGSNICISLPAALSPHRWTRLRNVEVESMAAFTIAG